MNQIMKNKTIQKLLPIEDSQDGITQTVNARDLHEFLEVGKDFSSWIKQQIKRGFFEEDIDFVVITQKGGN